MKKVVDKPVQIGEKRTRHTFKVYDDPSDLDTVPGRMRLWRFLQEFVDQPALLQCGPAFAQKMSIFHTGQCWVLQGEAEADDV
jgi:hypothetical protein